MDWKVVKVGGAGERLVAEKDLRFVLIEAGEVFLLHDPGGTRPYVLALHGGKIVYVWRGNLHIVREIV